MITQEIIKTLNTQNIAENNEEKVKKFMEDFWDKAPSQIKKSCISLGGYIDARPFWKTKKMGKISCRMVISLSLGLSPKVNPFFITGVSDDKEYSDIKLIDFLKQMGFSTEAQMVNNEPQLPNGEVGDVNILNSITEEFKYIIKDSLTDIQNCPEVQVDELITLLKNLEIKTRISNDEGSKIKLNLIKRILISK